MIIGKVVIKESLTLTKQQEGTINGDYRNQTYKLKNISSKYYLLESPINCVFISFKYICV